MDFRLAKEADFEQLAHLRWDWRAEDNEIPAVSKEEFIRAFVQFLKQGLEAGSRAYWIAETEGEIVSHIFIQKIDLVPRPCRLQDQCGSVTNNYTKPNYRGQGIGSELMRHVKAWAKAQDFEVLISWPSDEAVRFYERAGFKKENDIVELKLRDY